jgi:hypothetical protein
VEIYFFCEIMTTSKNGLFSSLITCVCFFLFLQPTFVFCQINPSTTSTLHVTISAYHSVKCFGDVNGFATASVTGNIGPVSFSWHPGLAIFTPTASGLSPGTYYVLATDSIGNHDSAYVTITQPALLKDTINFTRVTCTGLANGTATALPSGGTLPYTFSWNTSPVQNTAGITGLAPGVYSLTLLDSNVCIHTNSVTIVQPGGIIKVSPIVCNMQLSAFDSLGAGPYSWSWSTSPAQTTSSIVVNTSGTYSVFVIDTSHCSHVDSITVILPTPPPVPVITLVGGSLVCNAIPPCQWFLMGVPLAGVTDSLFHPSVNGIYTVDAGTLPCVTFSAPYSLTSAGIPSYGDLYSELRIYPNPASEETQLLLPPELQDKKLDVKLYAICGKELHETVCGPIINGVLRLNLREIPNGLYFLSLYENDIALPLQRKLVIQH